MKTIQNDILNIQKGVIVHQVNCQNRIGAGVAGQLISKYPAVKQAYHALCQTTPPEKRFRLCQPVRVTKDLIVINSFSQFYYGNSKQTGRIYTDMDKLVSALERVCQRYPDQPVYVPSHIGCGLAGGNWDELCRKIEHLPLIVVDNSSIQKNRPPFALRNEPSECADNGYSL